LFQNFGRLSFREFSRSLDDDDDDDDDLLLRDYSLTECHFASTTCGATRTTSDTMAVAAAPPTCSAPDPVDVIDAADLVDGVDDYNDMEDDGVKEFHAFEKASTLEPTTVETAQLLAQEANEAPPSSPKKQKDVTDVTANSSLLSMSRLSLSSSTYHEGGATTTTTTIHSSVLVDTTTTGGGGGRTSGERSSSSHSLVDDDGKPISEHEQSEKDKKRFVTPKDFELLKVIGIGAFVSCVAAKITAGRFRLCHRLSFK
jgi:hypothetical protein